MSLALALLVTAVASSAPPPYVIALGVNRPSGTTLPSLSYADDDAVNAASLFGAAPDRTWLLTIADESTQELHPDLVARARPPTRDELRLVTEEAAERIAKDRRNGGSPVVLVWLVGHGVVPSSDEGALALADGLLTARDLRETVLAPLSRVAHRVHLVADACHAAALIRSRAMASPADPVEATQRFSALEAVPFSNVGVLLSAAADQKSYEWDRMRGGVFSALVRSALRGLADANLDGNITYVELAAFVTAAVEAVPNPAARPRIDSRPPAVDLNAPIAQRDWFEDAVSVRVNEGAWGRFSVEDPQGRLVAAANLEPGFEPQLWTPMRRRLVATTERGRFIWVKQGEQYALAPDATPVPTARGDVDDALREGILGVAFGPGYHRGFKAALAAKDTTAPRQDERSAPVEPRRFLALGALPLWAFAIPVLGVGAAGTVLGLYGAYEFANTRQEVKSLVAAATAGTGGAIAFVSVVIAATLVVGGIMLVVTALR